MAFFVKLFSGLVQSTVWREELHVKVVWITLLALCDPRGEVSASIPGLASSSGVSLDQCLDALRRLQSPDEWSRTKEHEGRRIEEIDGGWRVINYLKYRHMRDDDRRKDQVREATRRWREKKRGRGGVEGRNITEDHSEEGDRSEPIRERARARARNVLPSLRSGVSLSGGLSVEGSVEDATDNPLVGKENGGESWSRAACDGWIERFGGVAPGGQIGRHLKPLVERHGWEEVNRAWRTYLAESQASFANAARFASTYGEWSMRANRPLPL